MDFDGDWMTVQSCLTIQPSATETHTAAQATQAESVAYSLDSRVHVGPGLDSRMPANHASTYANLLGRLDQDVGDQRPRVARAPTLRERNPTSVFQPLERGERGMGAVLEWDSCKPPPTAAWSALLPMRRWKSSLSCCDAPADEPRGPCVSRGTPPQLPVIVASADARRWKGPQPRAVRSAPPIAWAGLV